jgi:hypothetical protein
LAARRGLGAAGAAFGCCSGGGEVDRTRVEVGSTAGTADDDGAAGHGRSESTPGAAAAVAAPEGAAGTGTCWGTFNIRPHPLHGNAEPPAPSSGCLAPHSGQSNTGAIYALSCSAARSS